MGLSTAVFASALVTVLVLILFVAALILVLIAILIVVLVAVLIVLILVLVIHSSIPPELYMRPCRYHSLPRLLAFIIGCKQKAGNQTRNDGCGNTACGSF